MILPVLVYTYVNDSLFSLDNDLTSEEKDLVKMLNTCDIIMRNEPTTGGPMEREPTTEGPTEGRDKTYISIIKKYNMDRYNLQNEELLLLVFQGSELESYNYRNYTDLRDDTLQDNLYLKKMVNILSKTLGKN